jgi:hypothetical protein
MSVLTIVTIALAALVVALVLRAIARGRRERQLLPYNLDQSSPSLPLSRGRSEPPAAAPAPVEPAKPAGPAEPAEPAPAERPRATIPPMFAKALSEPEIAIEEAAPEAPPEPAPVPAPESVAAPSDRAAIEAEDPERKKARRLARLCVSEIKLYNEKLVSEGLAAGDLYTRLKDPIDQAVVLFQRRVPEAVRAEFDYVHDELVRQLAGGDASKLGPHYGRQRRG